MNARFARCCAAHLVIAFNCSFQPVCEMKAFEEEIHEEGGVELCRARLNEKEIGVAERGAKVILHVGHGLAFHLHAVSHPHIGVDLVEADLKLERVGEHVDQERLSVHCGFLEM